ncbi:MAG: glycosyltransferase family 39 protein [Thermodesulfovibrionales bacterium]|nr:glycosyltransferase family 39 protein [Thermodesulfovibrionales bacterium]
MSFSEIDISLFFFVNHVLQNNLFDITMPFITSRAYLLLIPFVALFFLKDWKRAGIVLILSLTSLALSDWGSHMLKHVFERPRPCNALEGVHLLVGCSSSYSMPSNHAVNAFAFASPFFILFKNKIRYAFVIVALLVGFSRVYVGVHYPSDVLVGALMGVALAISVIGLYKWSYERFKEKPYTAILFIFLLAISLFRIYYITRGPFDLSPDEAHYWEWSRRLDWSYYSKGPVIAYLIHIGTAIFGDTVFGIRIMAVVFSAFSSVIIYILGKKLYDEQVGLLSAILIQIVPLFSIFGVLFTIDSPFIFFWILSLFLFWKAISSQQSAVKTKSQESGVIRQRRKESKNSKDFRLTTFVSRLYWPLLGLFIGLGLLTKYTMTFFYLCAFLFLLLSKEDRRLLLTKGPYIACIISLAVFSPVIIWNADHDWVTFKHTAGQVHMAEGIQASLKSFFEFLGSQFGVITPFLLILMAVSVWRLRKQREGAFLFWFSVPIIAFFLLKSLQAKVQANWALPGYLAGIIVFSAFYINPVRKKVSSFKASPELSNGVYSEGRGTKIFIATAVLLSMVVTSLAHYPSILNLPAKMDPTSRLRGWKELGAEVTGLYEKMSATRSVFIFSDRYQVSSELAFYIKGHPVTYCINLGRRMNQYDLWPGFSKLLHHDAIFVRIGDTAIPGKVANAFEKVEKRVFTVHTKKKMKIRDYSLFLCYDFKGIKEEKPGSY